ncbi:glutathione S-transferase family protein [Pelagibius litoralis]|uniref:Glutathione S-transferase family protein n=1 Tax=Pelagibius litoralis TaxID=374515 RepID=A0A967C2U1_9PROT|nr:glutathione S-transferase family protein [Pelagibius litoralis]NIA67330.1 glutathione S-transferase family protein [Pelagibius litoralis]
MARLTLWGRLSSCNVQKVLWVLEELELPYERIDAGGDFGGLDEPAYRAMNPHGTVPTLRDGEQVVWDSDAIIRYLAASYGKGRLWPEDPGERAVADQWLAWVNSTLYRDWIDLFWMLVRTPPEQQDAAGIEARRSRTAARLAVLDRRLAESAFVSGDALGLADIAAGMTLYRWFEMPIERPELAHVEAWYRTLRERAAYVNAVCRPFEDLKGKLGY